MNAEKYTNIDLILPELNDVLKEAIQSDVLEIKTLDKACSKFLNALKEHPELKEAEFVVFSPYIRKCDHPFEHFVFLDRTGRSVCHISGAEMELYGLMENCNHLLTSPDFERAHGEEA